MSCLEHHGIKGQKWGVRRFQNTDGSLTPDGKKRYGVDDKKVKYKVTVQSPFEKKQEKLARKEQRMTEKEEIQRRKNELKERQKNLKNLGKSKETIKKENEADLAKKKSAKDMTDDELRAVINRYNLERQYNEIVNSSKTKKGSNIVSDTLKKSGATLLSKYTTKALDVAIDSALKKAGIDLRTSDEKRKDREAAQKKADERRKAQEQAEADRAERMGYNREQGADAVIIEDIINAMDEWSRRRRS